MLNKNHNPKRLRDISGYKAICRRLVSPASIVMTSPHMNILLFGLSLLFSYSHLLFSPTLALPVEGVGVPGVMLLELSPNKLPLIELP